MGQDHTHNPQLDGDKAQAGNDSRKSVNAYNSPRSPYLLSGWQARILLHAHCKSSFLG